MIDKKTPLVIFSLLFFPLLTISTHALQDQINVTAFVPGTNKITFIGKNSPFSTITISDQVTKQSFGEYYSDKNGHFSAQLDLNLGNNKVLCFDSEDIENQVTEKWCTEIIATVENGYIINVILPPTINANFDINGNGLIVSGFTIPNAKVNIILDDEIIASINSNDFGFYRYEVPTNDSFTHTISTQTISGNEITNISKTISFDNRLRTCGVENNNIKISRWIRDIYDYWWVVIVIIEVFTIVYFESRRSQEKRKKKEMDS